jgi:hypothetical protein
MGSALGRLRPLHPAARRSGEPDPRQGGFAWGDYDGDGLIDLLAVDFYSLTPGLGRIYVFRNRGDGAFERTIIEPSEYSHTGFINSATWGDFDGDGTLDILVTTIDPNRSRIYFNRGDGQDSSNVLCRNNRDGTLTRVFERRPGRGNRGCARGGLGRLRQ